MRIIDAHTHFFGGHPKVEALLDELDLKYLNLCMPDEDKFWHREREAYRKIARRLPHYYAWCTAFSPPTPENFANPAEYAESVLAELKQDIASGAVACKIWKNIGMEVRDGEGNFAQMDHPIFKPLYEYLVEANLPMLSHMAEPIGCWQPLTKDNPHWDYYSGHPEWHMHGRSDFPSHEQIMAARDRVLQENPGLVFIAAHMGSLEHDLDALAGRLDRFPNMAVDASRTYDMLFLDRLDVRDFFIRYQDRIVYATDLVVRDDPHQMDDRQLQDTLDMMTMFLARERTFYETEDELKYDGKVGRGIALPEDVLHKLYYANALKWYPGVE